LSFLDSAHQRCYFFNLQKLRQTFYPQIQFWSFHKAKTRTWDIRLAELIRDGTCMR